MKQLRTIRKATKTKYYHLINECYVAKDFDIETMRKRHQVGRVIFSAMHESKIITIKNNRGTWITNHVTDAMLNDILVCYEKIKLRHQAAMLLRKHNIDAKKIVAKQQQPIAQPSPVINPSPIEKAHVTPTQHAEINVDDRALRNAFITGFVIGVLISCAIAAMW